ncbi:hypothetical protein V7O66_11915 [Methanolobus sp. ZRKC3]|uniref:hypothetical protein n=1 Tax=Methanolobus sp. ZRKC3 TaxID=3125786 RepID=UPI003243FE91
MIKKLTLVSTLLVLMLAVSGCTDSPVDGEDIVLPEGYEYLGSPPMSVEDVKEDYVSIDGIVGASESLYKYSDVDLYIDMIELESSDIAEEFIVQYKAEFKQMTAGSRFTEVSFNDHPATVIQEHVTVGAEQVPRYTYIWANGNFVYVVGGNTDDSEILKGLAESTGF